MLRPAITLVMFFTLLLGVVMPLAMTAAAGLAMPRLAGGSLIERDGRIIGSALLGQNFAEDRYFHPRPSATSAAPYDAAASAASQPGPTSAALLAAVKERVGEAKGVPADAASASGSGLDPHISPANAAMQAARVAAARHLPEARVAALVADHTEGRAFGLLGAPRVNVLRLNLALDAAR